MTLMISLIALHRNHMYIHTYTQLKIVSVTATCGYIHLHLHIKPNEVIDICFCREKLFATSGKNSKFAYGAKTLKGHHRLMKLSCHVHKFGEYLSVAAYC